ncbi:dTMP kinase, partial [Streptomyces sp. AF1A]
PLPNAPGVAPDASTVPTPVVAPRTDAAGARPGATPGAEETVPTPVVSPGTDGTAVLRRVTGERDGSAGQSADAEVTAELPQPAVSGAADETAVLPPVPTGPADETAVLPPVPPTAADETAVLPPVRDEDPAHRVPPGFFREERSAVGPDGTEDRTREMPQLDADGTPRRRPRPDWAEETPLDDLPSLADELLGSYDDQDHGDHDGGQSGRGRGRRG